FAELGGTYRISRGIVTNNDLLLKSPLLRLTGKGTVDLPRRRVNYRIEPKVVASVKGQGGAAGASGIKVPVMVQGPWDDLSYRPDLAGAIGGIAKDPGKALESVKDLLPGKPGGGTTESAPSPSPVSNPLELLKGLFGR
ncbi:MAG: AsmA family protein, partial [Alphaproteobacteria bacterium]|nr:AsmA family protein [Alphaproteobacteria bacterium]